MPLVCFLCSVYTTLETEPNLLKSMTWFEDPGHCATLLQIPPLFIYFGPSPNTSIKMQIHLVKAKLLFLKMNFFISIFFPKLEKRSNREETMTKEQKKVGIIKTKQNKKTITKKNSLKSSFFYNANMFVLVWLVLVWWQTLQTFQRKPDHC